VVSSPARLALSAYKFDGPDLSHDGRVEIKIDDHYSPFTLVFFELPFLRAPFLPRAGVLPGDCAITAGQAVKVRLMEIESTAIL